MLIALASSLAERVVPGTLVAFGELGLTGEVLMREPKAPQLVFAHARDHGVLVRPLGDGEAVAGTVAGRLDPVGGGVVVGALRAPRPAGWGPRRRAARGGRAPATRATSSRPAATSAAPW